MTVCSTVVLQPETIPLVFTQVPVIVESAGYFVRAVIRDSNTWFAQSTEESTVFESPRSELLGCTDLSLVVAAVVNFVFTYGSRPVQEQTTV